MNVQVQSVAFSRELDLRLALRDVESEVRITGRHPGIPQRKDNPRYNADLPKRKK